jgi:hypothetical protein
MLNDPCPFFVLQGDQKVSVLLMIAVQKTRKNLSTLSVPN